MKAKYIKLYLGMPVIVQLKDAMAIGQVSGSVKPAPVTNADGAMLLQDGSVAPKDAKSEDIAVRPVWPIAVRIDPDKSPRFRYAIEDALISVAYDDALVTIHYRDPESNAMFELAVEPEAIVGITCVRSGEMPKQESRLIRPQN